MRVATFFKVLVIVIGVVWLWTFYIEEEFINYFTNGDNRTNETIKVHIVPCNQSEDGPYLAPDTEKINRQRTVDVLSYNDTKIKLEYADLTWQICIMLKNQAPDIAEWIETQYLMGATHISIYDHGSTDNLTDIIKLYMNESVRASDPYFPQIELIRWPPRDHTEDVLSAYRQFSVPDEHKDTVVKIAICKAGIGLQATHASGHCQQAMIADCATRFRTKRDWISWHDVDEFFWVLPQSNGSLHPTVSSHLKRERADLMSPYMSTFTFGNNGYQNRNEYAGQLVIETHTQRAPYEQLQEEENKLKESIPACSGSDLCNKGGGKSISRGIGGNWYTTQAGSPHYLDKIVAVQDVTYPLRMNHYQMKSVQEARESSRKQNKDWNYDAVVKAGKYWNAIFDDGLAKFSPEIKKRLKEKNLL